MIEEAIIHVGMHKTGSSSIQETLHHLEPRRRSSVGYLKLNSPNHSAFFMTLLSDKPEEYHAHRLNGRSKNEVRRMQFAYARRFESALEDFEFKKVVLSAEALSSPVVTAKMLDCLKISLSKYCERIRIIGYVRSPVSYMQSAFQERLKGGVLRDFELKCLWPHYRKRFHTLDEVFGRDNVDLVPFVGGSLLQEDVVLDFAQRAGVDLHPNDLIRSNDSISLEATALLFVLRYFENVPRYNGFTVDNQRLVSALSGVGKNKLIFSSESVMPILQAHRDDLGWINNRLGSSIDDLPLASDETIGTVDDLFSVARRSKDALLQLLDKHTTVGQADTGAAELLDRLYLLAADGGLIRRGNGPEASDDFAAFRDPAKTPEALLREAAWHFSRTESEVAATFRRMADVATRMGHGS